MQARLRRRRQRISKPGGGAERRRQHGAAGVAHGVGGRWQGVEAFDDRLFVGVLRAPAGGPQAIVGDHPRVDEVGHDVGWNVAQAARPQAGQQPLEQLGRQRGQQRPGQERPGVVGAQPPVGGDVVRAREVASDRQQQRADQVVDVDDLHGRAGAPDAQRRPSEQQARREPLGAGAEHGRRAHGRDRDRGVLLAPVAQESLDLGGVDGGCEARVGTQGGVLGQGHGVVGPRPVDGRARDADDLPHADGGGGVEDPPGALDVDARHQRLVGNRVDDRGQVDEHVGRVEEWLELGAADVDPVELEVPDAAQRVAHIEADQPRHLLLLGQSREQPLPHEPGCAGDGNRNHVHRLAA